MKRKIVVILSAAAISLYSSAAMAASVAAILESQLMWLYQALFGS